MKKSTVIIRFASIVSLLILLGFASYYFFIFARCFFVSKDIVPFYSVSLMRVMVYGKSPESMSAHISLMDSSGKEFAVIDRSWSNSSLYIEFSSASFKEKEIYFPIRIYSGRYLSSGRMVAGRGLDLTRYYMDGDECSFVSAHDSKEHKSAVGAFAVFAVSQSKKFQSRFSKIRTINISDLQDAAVYEVVIGSNGSLNVYRM